MNAYEQQNNPTMSEVYWKLWNKDVQAKIDRDIEAHRKADASMIINGLTEGTQIKVEQVSHTFKFGSHIFNFNQLGTPERNEKYKDLFGTLFNSATIPFYWAKHELTEGQPRFEEDFKDTEAYWNNVLEPKKEPHWRRPATDPIVEFCENKGIRRHGHTLIWGNCRWHTPEWLFEKLPEPYRSQCLPFNFKSDNASREIFKNFTEEQIEKILPEFTEELNFQMSKRIMSMAIRYKNRLHCWDVVNESATDFELGLMTPGSSICKSTYGLMPGDYTYKAFQIANGMFPKDVELAINDYNLRETFYSDQLEDLIQRGNKIDIMGLQKHIFNPQLCLDIADGKSEHQSPEKEWDDMERMSKSGLPFHLSEITIPSPNNDERGQMIQAIVARNLYRLWFSIKPMMGITWWNIVDDCGAPGEPSVSGIFSRNMEPKPAFFALNDLINKDWKTNLNLECKASGLVEFRGFRGHYRISWKDQQGQDQSTTVEVQ